MLASDHSKPAGKTVTPAPMDRAELERAIWRNAPGLASGSSHQRSRAIENVLAAADAYAEYTGGITAQRRAELDVPDGRSGPRPGAHR